MWGRPESFLSDFLHEAGMSARMKGLREWGEVGVIPFYP